MRNGSVVMDIRPRKCKLLEKINYLTNPHCCVLPNVKIISSTAKAAATRGWEIEGRGFPAKLQSVRARAQLGVAESARRRETTTHSKRLWG